MIYYPVHTRSVTLMLLIYPTNQQDDLTPEQKCVIAALVRAELEQAGER